MHHHGHDPGSAGFLPPVFGEWIAVGLLCAAVAVYVAAGTRLRRRGIPWPTTRTFGWVAGCLLAGVALVGPLAEWAHHDFAFHMAGHVLLGMLAPLLLVLAAPVTLALRVLPVRVARHLARTLASSPAEVLTHPAVAALLNVGGLWVLYRTGLYAATHTDPLLHVLVHLHVLAAGYLFVFAVLGGPDPAPHRIAPLGRAAALVAAIAAHNILAKTLYAVPPEGVPAEQAQVGAQFMYYAGAPVEIAMLVLLCRSWPAPRSDRVGTARG